MTMGISTRRFSIEEGEEDGEEEEEEAADEAVVEVLLVMGGLGKVVSEIDPR